MSSPQAPVPAGDRDSVLAVTVERERSQPGSPVPVCKQEPGIIYPVIDLKRCEGKGDCERVCPESVFEVRRIDDSDYRQLGVLNRFKLRVHGFRVAYTPNADACRSCGLCVTACPEHAITLAKR